jgi:hypothetical protein
VRSENGVTCSPCKQDVSSQSGLVSPYARQITRRSDDIPPHPRSMNTPHASYPIDRWCSSLKRKRAVPYSDSTPLATKSSGVTLSNFIEQSQVLEAEASGRE